MDSPVTGTRGKARKHIQQQSIKAALARVTHMTSSLQAVLNDDPVTCRPRVDISLEPWQIPQALYSPYPTVTTATKDIVWEYNDQADGDEGGWAVPGADGDAGYAQHVDDMTNDSAPPTPSIHYDESTYSSLQATLSITPAVHVLRDSTAMFDYKYQALDSSLYEHDISETKTDGFITDYDVGNPFRDSQAFEHDSDTAALLPPLTPSTPVDDMSKTSATSATRSTPALAYSSGGDLSTASRYKTPANKKILAASSDKPSTSSVATQSESTPFLRQRLEPGPALCSEGSQDVPAVTVSDALVSSAQPAKLRAAKGLSLYDKLVKKTKQVFSNMHVAGLTNIEEHEKNQEDDAVPRPSISNPVVDHVKLPPGYRPSQFIDLNVPELMEGHVTISGHYDMPPDPPKPLFTLTFCDSAERVPLFTIPHDTINGAPLPERGETRPKYWVDDLCKCLNMWIMDDVSRVQDISLRSIAIGAAHFAFDAAVQPVVANIDHNAKHIRIIHAVFPEESLSPLDPPDMPLEWVVIEIIWSFEKRSSSVICLPHRCIFRTRAVTPSITSVHLGYKGKVPAVSGFNVDTHLFDEFINAYHDDMAYITLSIE